jgi:hypothetical protein
MGDARYPLILQLCVYSEIVSSLQERAPKHLWVASPAGATAAGEAAERRSTSSGRRTFSPNCG